MTFGCRFLGCALAFACLSFGATITFSDTTVASGTLDGTPFTAASITISAIADTSTITTPFSGAYEIVDISASVTIGGVGTFAFTTPTGFFVNTDEVGFQRADAGDLIDGPASPAFANWNLLSSIGPITGSAEIFQWESKYGGAVNTTAGQLILSDATAGDTFDATVTGSPEPGTLALIITGLGALVLARGTRQSRPA